MLYLIMQTNKASKANIAVITGDIIGYSVLNAKERAKMQDKLKTIFDKIFTILMLKSQFEIFRGDSFQGVVHDTSRALQAAFWIKAGLLLETENDTSYDCRMAIGIGEAELLPHSILESDGEAFRFSGPLLDKMGNEQRVRIKTADKTLNEVFEISCILADEVLKRWTPTQAEILEQIMQGKTQAEVAKQLHISQPAVSKSLKASSWNALEAFIVYFESSQKTTLD